jgi:hypothetical protein
VPKDAGDGISTLTNLHCFESPLGSGNVCDSLPMPNDMNAFLHFLDLVVCIAASNVAMV